MDCFQFFCLLYFFLLYLHSSHFGDPTPMVELCNSQLLDLRKRKGRNDEINAGQMEDTGTHSKNLPAAKEGRAGASGAAGQSPNVPCLLVPRTSQATAQTPSLPPAPIPDSSPPLNRFPGSVWRGLNLIHTYIQGRCSLSV